MRRKLLTILCALLLSAQALPAVAAPPQRLDVGVRLAVYLTGNKSVIDLSKDSYVAAGGAITVKKSQATGCDGDKCKFNLGVVAFRQGTTNPLNVYGQFTGKTLGIVGNTIVFQNGDKIKQQVLPVSLMHGRNIVTFTLDPQNKVAETDENNNSFTVTIVVQ
jgi:hypothetical protein